MSDIHLEDYTEQYEGKQAAAATMVFDSGRKRESLNGQWHYAVDPYDTCLRQKWFLERYYDENGSTMAAFTAILSCCGFPGSISKIFRLRWYRMIPIVISR